MAKTTGSVLLLNQGYSSYSVCVIDIAFFEELLQIIKFGTKGA